MRHKKLITVISIIFACVFIVVVVGGVVVFKSIISPLLTSKEVPPELREPRVVTGAGVLVKSEFYQAGKESSWGELTDPDKLMAKLDSVHDMAVGQLDGQEGLDIGLAGQFGLTLLDRRGNVTKRINYRFEKTKVSLGPITTEREKNTFNNIRLLDVEGDGVCEVLALGILDGMALFDHQGNVLFSRGEYGEGKPSIREVGAGDVDGDGVNEFIVSWSSEPANRLELLDHSGKSRWRRDEEITPGQFEVVDVDGDGQPELVEENGSQLKIRDAKGEVKSVAEAPVYLWQVSLCQRPDKQGLPQNLAVRRNSLWLIDLDGKNHTKFDAPLSQIKLEKPRVVPGLGDQITFDTEDVYRAKGVWAELKKDQPKYLAVIANFSVIDRSLFYLYDANGKLIYHEILPEECDAVALLPPENGSGQDEILVSGSKTVWRYAMP